MKLGSLFDGSGTCPLAASAVGIIPAWASEIEPFPKAVTQSRFPKIGVRWFLIRTLRSTRCGEMAWLFLVCSTSWRVFKKSLPKGIWIISLEVIPQNEKCS